MNELNEVAGGSAEIVTQLIATGTMMSELPLRDHPEAGKKLMLVPVGFKLETLVDADHAPTVTRRAPQFLETQSFIDYVNAFKLPDQTRIFIHPDALKAVAVIDYDKAGEAGRGVHRAGLKLELSPEWIAWNAAADQTKQRGFTQEDFAEFLEEHGQDVVMPTAADLIDLVTKMQVTRNVNYKRSINLQDGRQQFTYLNDSESGSTEFPAKLELGIPAFKGGQPYKVTVLLRYRLQDGGALRFAMIIHRKDEILRDAMEGDIAAMREATQVPVHIGVAG